MVKTTLNGVLRRGAFREVVENPGPRKSRGLTRGMIRQCVYPGAVEAKAAPGKLVMFPSVLRAGDFHFKDAWADA